MHLLRTHPCVHAAAAPPRYVNVSLEFNTLTLQPTYRLLWGSAGSSNALDIATALGFDPAVLADARILAHAELGRQEEQQGRMEQVCAHAVPVHAHAHHRLVDQQIQVYIDHTSMACFVHRSDHTQRS